MQAYPHKWGSQAARNSCRGAIWGLGVCVISHTGSRFDHHRSQPVWHAGHHHAPSTGGTPAQCASKLLLHLLEGDRLVPLNRPFRSRKEEHTMVTSHFLGHD